MWPDLNQLEAVFALAFGLTSLFGAGNGIAGVMSQTLRGLLAGNVYDVSSSALIGSVIRCTPSAASGVGALVTRSRLACLIDLSSR